VILLPARTLNAESNAAIEALPPLRDVIAQGGLQATKALGQNFLLDLNLTNSIARLNGPLDGLSVVEIGPGPGGLTRALLLNGAQSVDAIEFDARAIAVLEPLVTASGGRLRLHHKDALNADVPSYGDTVIANLPYNVATPILINLLKNIGRINFMLLMFQKEVAERIAAKPDSSAYGRLSVMSQWLCQCKVVKTLPPGAFTPPPKISSAVVLFKPRALADQPKFETMEKIVATAFNQRRKMLRSSLGDYAVHLEAANIDSKLRAEDVDVDSYVRLAKIVEAA
jgi:16S rRNA (adenine1518-N6/adenine1519-N6)-dimethyltransferase